MKARNMIRRRVAEMGYKCKFTSVDFTDLCRESVVRLQIIGLPSLFFGGVPPEHREIVNWKSSQEFKSLKVQFASETGCKLIG